MVLSINKTIQTSALAFLIIGISACGTPTSEAILGSWNCKSQLNEDGMIGSYDVDVTYVSSGKSSLMGTMILNENNNTMTFKLASNGEWSIHNDLLEETASDLTLISLTYNGTELSTAQKNEMRAILDPIISMNSSSKIISVTDKKMLLENEGDLVTCTR